MKHLLISDWADFLCGTSKNYFEKHEELRSSVLDQEWAQIKKIHFLCKTSVPICFLVRLENNPGENEGNIIGWHTFSSPTFNCPTPLPFKIYCKLMSYSINFPPPTKFINQNLFPEFITFVFSEVILTLPFSLLTLPFFCLYSIR